MLVYIETTGTPEQFCEPFNEKTQQKGSGNQERARNWAVTARTQRELKNTFAQEVGFPSEQG